ELSAFSNDRQQYAMLVPQANCMRLVFPNVETGGLFEFPFEDFNALKNFLFSLSLARIHIHHVKGWEGRIYDLLKLLDVPYDITLHDYYFLHVNPALADKRGHFCVEPRSRDALSADAIPFPKGVDAEQWRERWKSLLKRAERVIAPSNATAAIYNQYHPSLEITCAFHPDNEMLGSYPPVHPRVSESNEPMHVVVMGALSIIKGANMLERVSQLAFRQQRPLKFTLIGYAYKKLANTVHTTGAYKDEIVRELLQQAKPDLIWFPCTWPETYSYTLSYALESGLPVACPNIGSFPERLHNRPHTWIEDWDMDAEQWLAKLESIRHELMLQNESKAWLSQPNTQFSYRANYVHPGVIPEFEFVDAEHLMSHWLMELPEASTVNRRFYRALIWLNSHRLFGHVANLIPMWIRRNVKRRLSTRPLHE
ncbi:MAG: hypothetical protein MI746_06710, partial [Pseudomonadales bacterium]|nr:hypothetical protein [Pseudomonadales bacterium]